MSFAPILRISLLNKFKVEGKEYFCKYHAHFCPCETARGCHTYVLDQLMSWQKGGEILFYFIFIFLFFYYYLLKVKGSKGAKKCLKGNSPFSRACMKPHMERLVSILAIRSELSIFVLVEPTFWEKGS